MKKSKTDTIFIIVIIALITLAGISLISGIIKTGVRFGDYKLGVTSKEKIVDQEYEINFNSITLNIEEGEVYIKESADTKTRVVIYGNEDKTTVSTKDKKLSIKVKEKLCFGICLDDNPKVEVYLPNSYSNKIKVAAYYGNVNIENFPKATINLYQDFGDIKIGKVKDLDIYSDYGNVEIQKAETAKIEAAAGDIKISTVANVTINNDAGDIAIKKITNYLDIYQDFGNITISEANLNKDSQITNDCGDTTITKTNNIKIKAKVAVGDKKINDISENATITLTITNNSGDIKVIN